ncbi:FMN reductase [Streptomyces sp. NPDC051569]|uniref:FMN reductase n=1 Tax=Streptomyces sp. NPDC051569 TaxID=3365661 RepID=UPI0037A43211
MSTRTLKVVTVSGSLQEPSKTVALTEQIVETLATRLPVENHRIDIHKLGAGFTGARHPDDLPESVLDEMRLLAEADLVIAASPVFRASYTGLFKHFFDLIENQYALANKLVLLAATGGSDRHALVLEHQFRPLFGFFQALTVPVALYASSGDFDGMQILNPEVHARIEVAVDDIAELLRARVGGTATEPAPAGDSGPYEGVTRV